MMNIKSKKGFKVVMTLAGLMSIYAMIFCYGTRVSYDQGLSWHARLIKGLGKEEVELKYRSLIISAASRHGVEPALVAAIMHAESNFNPSAVSPMGARGLMQINSVTQRHLRLKNVFSPLENVNGGAKYINELLSMFNGNIKMAIAAYNAGPNAVKRYGGVPPYSETRHYVNKVINLYKDYKTQLPTNVMLSSNN